MPEPTPPPVRLISIPELQRKCGLSRTAVWQLRRTPGFPAAVDMPGSNARPRFVESEIDDWLLSRPRRPAAETAAQTASQPARATNAPADDRETAGAPAAV